MLRMAADACSRPLLWVFIVAAFLWVVSAWSIYVWIPIIVSNLLNGSLLSDATSVGGGSRNSVQAALLSAIPYICAALSLVAVAWSADRHNEKTAHVAIPVILSGITLSCFGVVGRHSAVGAFVILTASLGLAFAGQSTLVARAAGITPPSQAGITLGILNASCTALGGFAGPVIVGAIIGALRSFEVVALVMGALLIAAGLIVLGVFVKEYPQFREERRARRAADGVACGGRRAADEEAGGGCAPRAGRAGGTLSGAATA
ncbi:hypothetical protein MNEG_14201 [Monoraphidium neglectum]|uniref:Major facilitator superfamily (MFS) profile domain-containing protein n=1 Tax=Monoraphidium neglectum TaxID=145388 RepID=A0A0D2LW24_9CHLO|nr:hypothetical protein MNEG_14201 [Monoraphidium neglectum]KIY93761.1 hypothetical protein MNEG_14201 [Monoraphidium neglectum]|eukprot:XP_013892781.1 hypothetical protein MNEG_14201 [Monoraphidium neglectum]